MNFLNSIGNFLFSDEHISKRQTNLDTELIMSEPFGIRFDILGLGDVLELQKRRKLMKSGWTRECISLTLVDIIDWCENAFGLSDQFTRTGVAIPYSLATGVVVVFPPENAKYFKCEATAGIYASAISALVSNRFRAHALKLRDQFPLKV